MKRTFLTLQQRSEIENNTQGNPEIISKYPNVQLQLTLENLTFGDFFFFFFFFDSTGDDPQRK